MCTLLPFSYRSECFEGIIGDCDGISLRYEGIFSCYEGIFPTYDGIT